MEETEPKAQTDSPPEKSKKSKHKGISKPDLTLNPDRYAVFKATLIPNDSFFAYTLVALIAAAGFLSGEKWSTYLLVGGIFVGLIVLKWLIQHAIHLLFFRGWREKIGYQIDGWENLVNRNILSDSLCWAKVTIEVFLNGNDENQFMGVKTYLKTFCDKTKKAFYSRDLDDVFGFDPRDNWEIEKNPDGDFKKLTAKGSANAEVIGKIYKLLKVNLPYLNRKYQNPVQKVLITVDDHYITTDVRISSTIG